MLGAVAATLGEPPLETLQDAAAEMLGGKTRPPSFARPSTKGYECRS